MISPTSTLVHLAVLLCHTLDISEDEWPNFEFYPVSSKKHNPDLYVNGILCALKFRSELAKIQKTLENDLVELEVKKKLII